MNLNVIVKNQIIKCQYQALMTISLALLLCYPFMVGTSTKELLLDTLTHLVFLAALIAVRQNKFALNLAILLLGPALVLTWLPLTDEPVWLEPAALIFTSLFVAHVTWQIFKAVFSQQIVSRDTLIGAICIYLLLGLLWSNFYLLLVYATPDAFDLDPSLLSNKGELSAHLLYYSYTTLTTVGYGDITPISLQARSIAIIEQITGVFYIAIMMARLVSMYQSEGGTHDE